MQKNEQRRKAIITGACGGMGRACARSMGATLDLVLSDIHALRLNANNLSRSTLDIN